MKLAQDVTEKLVKNCLLLTKIFGLCDQIGVVENGESLWLLERRFEDKGMNQL